MTKRVVAGWVLLLLGAFLLTTAVMMRFWAPDRAERTPLDVDNDTFLTGEADKLDPATGELPHLPVWVLSRTRVDPKKSDDKVVVFVSTACVNADRGEGSHTCLTGKDPRLITNAIDVFAADRHTGEAVNDSKYVSADTGKHEGLVNKFPFGTEKKDYQYWDSLLGKPVTAKYDSTVELDGLKTYKFTVSVPPSDAEVATDVDGTYSTDKQMWVEPRTGAIVDQAQHEVRKLPDGSTILDMRIRFTGDTVKKGIDDAKGNIRNLDLLLIWIPIIGLVAGLLSIAAGVLLLLRARRNASA